MHRIDVRFDDSFELDAIIDDLAADPSVDPASIAIVAAYDDHSAVIEYWEAS